MIILKQMYSFLCRKKIMINIFLILLFTLFAFPVKWKLTVPDQNNIMMGDLLTFAGKLDISEFLIKNKIKKKNIPRVISVKGQKNLFAFILNSSAMIIDPAKRKNIQTINKPLVDKIIKFKDANFFLICHQKKSGYYRNGLLSRYEIGSDKATWTIPFNVIFSIMWSGRGYGNTYKTIPFPGTFKYLKDSKILIYAGIGEKGSYKNKYLVNKLVLIDTETGKVISDRYFLYRRHIHEDLELYVDSKNKVFEIFDLSKGKTLKTIKFTKSEFPNKFGKYILIDPIRLIGIPEHPNNWEFSPLLTEKGLLMTVRKLRTIFVKESYWTLYDKDTGKAIKIEPAPLIGLDMALRNFSGKKWPVIVPDLTSWKGLDKPKSSSFWVIKPDGTMKKIRVPPPPIHETKINFTYNQFFRNKWIHDGKYLYFLSTTIGKIDKKDLPDIKLFRMKIGSNEAEPIYNCGPVVNLLGSILFGENGHLLMSLKDKIIIIKVPEGKLIDSSDLSGDLPTSISKYIRMKKYYELWKDLKETRNLAENLSRNGFPGNFKGFISSKPVKRIFSYYIPSIWGPDEGFTDILDIGLKPVSLTDKTVVLSGINMIKKKMEFYIPVLKMGFSKNVYASTLINKDEAIITVLSDPSTLKFYRLKRPR